MKKNIFFLCSFVCSFAAPVELCVSFECENCYSIRVQKIETLEKKQWSLSDSVACECGMWLPPSFEIKNLPGNYLSGVGGGCVAFEKKNLIWEPGGLALPFHVSTNSASHSASQRLGFLIHCGKARKTSFWTWSRHSAQR